jgi:hypothetical protein
MEIQNLVGKINHLLEPVAEEINVATKLTPNGIEVNEAMLMALKETKFNLMIQSLTRDLKAEGIFSTIEDKNRMFQVFQAWFNDYENKILKLERDSVEFHVECVFLFHAKDMIDVMFEG